VKSIGDVSFWKLYRSLPDDVRQETREAFRLFCRNPAHPGLSFERLRSDPESWSVRITRSYRAVGWKRQDAMVWYWIGSHADFDKKFRV
jgi:hypothetical protein